MAFKYAKNGRLRKLNKLRRERKRLYKKFVDIVFRPDPFYLRLKELNPPVSGGTFLETELKWDGYIE